MTVAESLSDREAIRSGVELEALGRTSRRHALTFAGLGGALVTLFVVAIAVGSVSIPLADVVTVLWGGEASRASWETIVEQIRVPRSITAVLVGAGLGVAGLQMQTLFRNPLADPFVLGISAGASVGVAAVVLLAGSSGSALFVTGFGWLGNLGIAGAATVGAAAVAAVVLLIASRVPNVVMVLIVGLMIGQAIAALVTVMLSVGDERRVQQFVGWGFGDFRGVTWSELEVLTPAVLAGIALAVVSSKQLNALLLGEGYARSLGLNVLRMRIVTIGAAALLAGVVTAFAGPIAFLGIAIPHLTRGLLGSSDHRLLLPGVILTGGCVALAAEVVAQLPGLDSVLPLNAVTALIGAPVVIAVLLRSRGGLRTFGG